MPEYGIYPVSWPGMSREDMLAAIKDAGFDFICADMPGDLPEYVRLAEKHGLPIDNIHLTGNDTNTVWEEGPRGDEVIERYKREMLICRECGIDRGIVHVTWGLAAPPLSMTGLMRFGGLVGFAEMAGFTICFENSVSAPHLRAVLDNIGSPNARFCLDTGHWKAFTADTDLPHEYADRLAATHIQDNDLEHDLHMLPFDGGIDFRAIRDVLAPMPRLTLEPGGIVFRKHGEIDTDKLSVRTDSRLYREDDDGVTVYGDITCGEYLARALNAVRTVAGNE